MTSSYPAGGQKLLPCCWKYQLPSPQTQLDIILSSSLKHPVVYKCLNTELNCGLWLVVPHHWMLDDWIICGFLHFFAYLFTFHFFLISLFCTQSIIRVIILTDEPPLILHADWAKKTLTMAVQSTSQRSTTSTRVPDTHWLPWQPGV